MMKVTQLIDNAMLRSTRAAPAASVFAPRHFPDFGRAEAVRKALSRLVQAGKIQRVGRGLYHLTRLHPVIGQTGPDIMATVRALMEGSRAPLRRWESEFNQQ